MGTHVCLKGKDKNFKRNTGWARKIQGGQVQHGVDKRNTGWARVCGIFPTTRLPGLEHPSSGLRTACLVSNIDYRTTVGAQSFTSHTICIFVASTELSHNKCSSWANACKDSIECVEGCFVCCFNTTPWCVYSLHLYRWQQDHSNIGKKAESDFELLSDSSRSSSKSTSCVPRPDADSDKHFM